MTEQESITHAVPQHAILQKLHDIMEEVSYIQKDAKNNHQGYTYSSERAIKEALHEALVKHGVMFQLSTANPRVEGNVTWIDCVYTFTDVDTGESITGTFLGSGQSRDEKGHYAAVTGAIKYILTSTFLIPTGDDPEDDENESKPPAKQVEPFPDSSAASFQQLKTAAQLLKQKGVTVSQLGITVKDEKNLTNAEASAIIRAATAFSKE